MTLHLKTSLHKFRSTRKDFTFRLPRVCLWGASYQTMLSTVQLSYSIPCHHTDLTHNIESIENNPREVLPIEQRCYNARHSCRTGGRVSWPEFKLSYFPVVGLGMHYFSSLSLGVFIWKVRGLKCLTSKILSSF